MSSLWSDCLSHLSAKVSPTDYNTWLRPLQASEANGELILYAQNRIVANWVKDRFIDDITELARFLAQNENLQVQVLDSFKPEQSPAVKPNKVTQDASVEKIQTHLISHLVFENFVQGSSNQLAKAVAQQVANNPGDAQNNPYAIYGTTGLGKTHLLHAIGNEILRQNPSARVLYITARNFIQEMVRAIQNSKMDNFKKFYHSLDVLMIDDIQFFGKAEKSQEEFFHTFNSLFEQGKQIIVASDVFPKSIENIEERLSSRLSWGMSAAIDPPDVETRAAILMKKAEDHAPEFERQWQHPLVFHEEAMFFMAQKLRTNVRELEGALKQVLGYSGFKQLPITVDLVRESLKDRIASYELLVTIENIQRTVADYYNIKMQDMKSGGRSRSIARPRQMAMALSKELTTHSLPEIGREFGGKDHTTVMHACKTIQKLRNEDSSLQEDYTHLIRKLSS